MSEYVMGQQLTAVRGLVIPVDWNENGDPIATAIFGKDEKRYVVDPDEKGMELLRYLQQDLDVEGVIRRNRTGHRVITVKTFSLAAANAT